MKMHLGDRPAVGPGLCAGDQAVDGAGVVQYRCGQRKAADLRQHLCQRVVCVAAAVVVMRRGIRMGFLRAVEADVHTDAADSVILGGLRANLDAGQPQRVHCVQKRFRLRAQGVQRSHEHVAGGAGRYVQKQLVHDLPSPV